MFADIAPILPFLESGRLKVLAVTSSQRVSALPNVPTVAESGIPGMKNFEGVAWQGLVAPAGTPAPVIDKLSREIVKIMAQPDVKTKLENDGLVVRTRAAGEFAQYIAMDLPRWGDAVKASGATLD
jgi:tripartite-type tricarboxylate transporter receptor subunit TctC